MVSLDPNTGGVRWFYQDRKRDLLDLDFQNTPVLTSVGATPIAIGSGKTGNIVAANAISGAVLWKTPVCIHQNDDVADLPTDEYLEIFPGKFGGVVTPIAYANGVVFAACVNVPQYQKSTGAGPNNGAFASGSSSLVAIDVANGRLKWEHKVNTVLLGGATVANDVVFTSGLDGFLRGFSAETGIELWTYESPSGFNASPAIAGDMLFAAAGFLKFPQGGGPAIGAAPDGSSAPVSKLTAFVVRPQ
jgi:outer membrane protein assembly factor BamB